MFIIFKNKLYFYFLNYSIIKSKLIELKNFVNEEKDIKKEHNIIEEKEENDEDDDESWKLEIKKIDMSELVDTNTMKNCILVGIISLIIAILLSIIAVNYVLNRRCRQYAPINLFSQRLRVKPIIIGQSGDSKHICYKYRKSLFVLKNGVLFKMDNIVIDPSKWRSDGYIYNGPINWKDRGCPLLSKGFFNMKLEKK